MLNSWLSIVLSALTSCCTPVGMGVQAAACTARVTDLDHCGANLNTEHLSVDRYGYRSHKDGRRLKRRLHVGAIQCARDQLPARQPGRALGQGLSQTRFADLRTLKLRTRWYRAQLVSLLSSPYAASPPLISHLMSGAQLQAPRPRLGVGQAGNPRSTAPLAFLEQTARPTPVPSGQIFASSVLARPSHAWRPGTCWCRHRQQGLGARRGNPRSSSTGVLGTDRSPYARSVRANLQLFRAARVRPQAFGPHSLVPASLRVRGKRGNPRSRRRWRSWRTRCAPRPFRQGNSSRLRCAQVRRTRLGPHDVGAAASTMGHAGKSQKQVPSVCSAQTVRPTPLPSEHSFDSKVAALSSQSCRLQPLR